MDLGPIIPDQSLIAFVARPLAIYLVVLAALRLFGKREVGELAPAELVMLLLLAETLQGALVAGDESIVGGIIAAGTLLSANWVIGVLAARYRTVERVTSGEPTILVWQGSYLDDRLRREHVSRAELDSQLREQGVFNIQDVDLVVMEPNGRISVRRTEEAGRPLDTEIPGEEIPPRS